MLLTVASHFFAGSLLTLLLPVGLVIVSASDSLVTAIIALTASFIAAPAPDGPRSTWPLVIASSTGATRA